MQLTFENLQSLLNELSAFIQLFVAILGLIAILLPFFQKISFHDDSTPILPTFITTFLYQTFTFLGIPQLIMYIRPKEYYENLSKKLNESELATTSEVADICLSSNVEADDDSALVSGLVNTGNSCFLNSVLQALSSLPTLHLYLEKVNHASSDMPLPVTRTLLKTLRTLVIPLYRRTSFRPVDIVTALSSNRRIISREQQDAQEFFQLISSAIDNEGQKVAKMEYVGKGLKDVLLSQPAVNSRTEWISRIQIANRHDQQPVMVTRNRRDHHLENPFTGLLANRLSCMQCGYTGAIRHFSFNNIQLNVPNKYTTTLESCLTQFTSMEYLQDASCRKCSFKTTIKTLSAELETLKHQSKKQRDTKKKRDLLSQLVTMEKAKREIEHRLSTGRIEEEHDQDKLPLLRSVSRMSSKQVMFAKPPQVLCLHISRSAYLNTGAVYKNTCHIQFPEILDVSPFSTNGTLHTQANVPISTSVEKAPINYRLMSVIVHYGSHSFGHFVAFKRRIYADPCQCHTCTGGLVPSTETWKCQHSWYRISDSKVDECSLDDVLRANPYMLLYELIDEEYEESVTSDDEEVLEEDVKEEVDFSYNHIPVDDATKEALRIANSLIMGDQVLMK